MGIPFNLNTLTLATNRNDGYDLSGSWDYVFLRAATVDTVQANVNDEGWFDIRVGLIISRKDGDEKLKVKVRATTAASTITIITGNGNVLDVSLIISSATQLAIYGTDIAGSVPTLAPIGVSGVDFGGKARRLLLNGDGSISDKPRNYFRFSRGVSLNVSNSAVPCFYMQNNNTGKIVTVKKVVLYTSGRPYYGAANDGAYVGIALARCSTVPTTGTDVSTSYQWCGYASGSAPATGVKFVHAVTNGVVASPPSLFRSVWNQAAGNSAQSNKPGENDITMDLTCGGSTNGFVMKNGESIGLYLNAPAVGSVSNINEISIDWEDQTL